MKDENIVLPESVVYSPYTQCYGKKQYKIKRRALKRAREYTREFHENFTIYLCPHCGYYHVGSVRRE